MKYKVGDEVLVKAKVHFVVNQDTELPYEVKGMDNTKDNPRTIWVSEKDIQSIPDMTAEEAWEIAKKLFADYSNTELDEIFGKGWSFPKLMELTPQQAKAKIEAWEAEKKIKVGDEVVPKENHYRCGERGIVVCINFVPRIGVNYPDDDFAWYEKDDIKKTGRHINIFGLLEQIGGTDA